MSAAGIEKPLVPVRKLAQVVFPESCFSFGSGDWAIESPGGDQIAAFRAVLSVPRALRWINRAAVSTVFRTSDLTLQWDPSGYSDREWMQRSVFVDTGSVICRAPAAVGSITIPLSLIAQLPSPTIFPPRVELQLTPTDSSPVLYNLPLVGGGSIPGISTFRYLEQVMVVLK